MSLKQLATATLATFSLATFSPIAQAGLTANDTFLLDSTQKYMTQAEHGEQAIPHLGQVVPLTCQSLTQPLNLGAKYCIRHEVQPYK